MARYALVVGIKEYKSPLHELTKPATDAEAVAQLLREHGDFQQVELIKGQVTGSKLGKALQTFLLEQAVNSEALIYFTGHGITVTDNLELQAGYLATSDCAIAIDANRQIISQQGGIALASLNDLIRLAQLSSLVVLLDCCHSGDFLERNLVQTLTAFGSRKDYYLITACRGFESAYAMRSEQHSIFTGAMLKGLSKENAGSDGKVSGDRLFAVIDEELRGKGQEPIRSGWGRSITVVKYQPNIPAVAPVVSEECPYQGLKAFQKQQREFFFGRKRVVEDIRQKLEQAQFVPVIGASGSGKSSVVRAGLIPWLEESSWQLLGLESSEPEVGLEPIRPGIEPLGELKRALARPFKRSPKQVRQIYEFVDNYPNGSPQIIEQLAGSGFFLLVVDQFEEVFTVCPQEEDRRRFIQLLTQFAEISASRLAVVITMRADFLEPCLNYPSLTQLIQTQAVYMPPLVGADLVEAIAEPAKLQGYRFEDGLLGEILQDVGKEPGFLPLLQFALTELWEKRDRQQHQLTLEQYRVLGGVMGALDRHAEQVYEKQLDTQQQRDEREKEWIKRIFLKLVRTGEGVKDTRQRQPKAKLLAIAGNNPQDRQAISDVIDELIRGRLLVTGQEDQQGEAWVDLAHEALMGGDLL